MNEKLTKWTLHNVRPKKKKGGNRGTAEALVVMSVVRDSKTKAGYLRISFHKKTIDQLGWLTKDNITFDYDEGTLVIYRSESGYGLGKTNAKKVDSRSYIRVPLPDEYCEVFEGKIASEIEIAGGRLALKLVEGE